MNMRILDAQRIVRYADPVVYNFSLLSMTKCCASYCSVVLIQMLSKASRNFCPQ